MDSRPTASIIIIGDEILKGQTQDSNSHFLCQELYKCGVHVSRVSVISDDTGVIAEEVKLHSRLYSFVLTSGGIGPTHDDVTYEGIAKAFDEKLVIHKDLKDIIDRFCRKMNLNEDAAVKMSCVPHSAEVHKTYRDFIPIVSVQNVFIFPGIPSYLQLAFDKLKTIFKNKQFKPYHNASLYIAENEFAVADVLSAAVKEYSDVVRFGSYPEVDNKHFQVRLVLEADTLKTLEDAEAYLRSHLPPNSVIGQFPPSSEEALKALLNMCCENGNRSNKSFAQKLKQSMSVLEKCFQDYSLDEVCLSFNGGKDCTALLHLTYLFLMKEHQIKDRKLKILYFSTTQPFPEIEDFIQQSMHRYDLEMLAYQHPIKEGLSNLKRDHPEIKAVLMGCRSTDPRCQSLKAFQMTDNDWPQFMRVNPLSCWSYEDVWLFLRELMVPYCSLYDKGYTSLGCRHNTLPNEELLTTTKEGESYYKPAYLLKNCEQERKGRSSAKSTS